MHGLRKHIPLLDVFFFSPLFLLLKANSDCRVLANLLYCAKMNRDKKDGKYAQFTGSGDDRDPEFDMIL
jgi:hypothetical protein